MSAYVDRARRRIASWSLTRYGITDEEIPDPDTATIATGSVSAGTAARQPAIGVTTTIATSIGAQAVRSRRAPEPGDPVRERARCRGRTARRSRARGQVRARLALDAHSGEQVDTGHGQEQRDQVS